MNINQVIIVGRLTKDPEKKSLPNGTSVVNASIATSRTYKDKSDKKVEETEFHNIVAFGKTADIMAQYLVKGQLVGVTGRLVTRNWEKDGHKNYRTEIMVDSMQMGPKAGTGGKEKSSDNGGVQTTQYEGELGGEIRDEDVPF